MIVSAIIVLSAWGLSNTDSIIKLKTFCEAHFSYLKQFNAIELLAIILLLALLVLVVVLHYLIQDNSAMKIHTNSFDEEFPEKEFKDRIKSFSVFLNKFSTIGC